MPKWIHDRAEHLLAKNPSMSESTAWAVATQQSHALGKSPKGYGTTKGKREAKAKYETPKDDTKKANPGGLDSPKLASFFSELTAIEKSAVSLADLKSGLSRAGAAVSQGVSRVTGIGSSAAKSVGPAVKHPLVGKSFTGMPAKLMSEPQIQSALRAADVASAARKAQDYTGLPQHVKDAILSSPLMRQGKQLGMTPEYAAALAGMSATPGESFGGAVYRTVLNPAGLSQASSGVGRIGRSAARAAKQQVMDAATKAASALWAESFFDELCKIAGVNNPYLHDQIGRPKVRKQEATPPDDKFKVKQGMFPTQLLSEKPASNLLKSQKTGTPDDKSMQEYKPLSFPKPPKTVTPPSGAPKAHAPKIPSMPKVGAAASIPQAHKGGFASFPLSGLPEGNAPVDEASEYDVAKDQKKVAFATSEFSGELGPARFFKPPMLPSVPLPNIYGRDPQLKEGGSKESELLKRAADALTPNGRLTQTQQEGKPKTTSFAGPSISDVSKPVGFGRTLPGTAKNRI